ncbi:apolipoprotein D-like [Macrobrachium rosenbergii]|uniref:apolipoprotein D-like n=1 Tax=Macrobrachium rosenbergii TaxID=79674 RepID=UPI0034D6BA84
MRAFGALVLTGLLVGIVGAHDWGWGACPVLQAKAKLNVDKYIGLWYVIELFDSSSTCQTLNYTRTSETQLSVTKSRQFYILDSLSIDHANTYTGKLDIPNEDNAGKMRVKWPLNIAGKADYTIFDTDYDTYAVVYECQQISTLAYRQSAAILSRSPTLDSKVVDRVKKELKDAGISISHFDKIDHSVCTQRSDASMKIDIDDNTFKDIVSSAGDGIKSVASTVANGASNLADTVVDFTRRLGASTDGNSASAPIKEDKNSDVEIIS